MDKPNRPAESPVLIRERPKIQAKTNVTTGTKVNVVCTREDSCRRKALFWRYQRAESKAT